MFRPSRLNYVLIIAVLLFATSTPLVAEDAGNAGAAVAADLQEAGTGFIETIRDAIQGDKAAMREAMDSYLLPAAMALILLIVGYMFASFVARMIGGTVTKRVDKTLGRFAAKMVRNVIMVMVLLGALGYFGVDVTSFAAILAAAGFAIGMALQGTLSNFAAGIMLLVFRPFKVDDYIKVGGVEGVVEEIDLFTTKLNTVDNRHLIIPNGKISGETMENFTRNEVRRVDVNVGAEYCADLRVTRTALEDAINRIAGSAASPAPQVYLAELGDSAVNWQCRVWCDPAVYWDVKERTTEAVKDALDQAGIGIPYPQMDVHVVGKVLAKAA